MKKLLALMAAALMAGALSSQAALVGWWNFDDGTANDSSGNNNNGTYQNGAGASADVPNATAGTMSLNVVGGTSHVLVPHDPSLDIASGAITIAAWVKPADGTWAGIVLKGPEDTGAINHAGNYELRFNDGSLAGNFGFENGPGGGTTKQFTDGATVIPVGQWTHVAYTMSGADWTFYLNGAQTGTGTFGFSFADALTNENPLYIGSRADLFTTLNGNIDELGIWDEALDATAISSIHANGIPEPASALLGLLGALGLVLRRRR